MTYFKIGGKFVKTDRATVFFYEDFYDSNEELRLHVRDGRQRHHIYNDVCQDIFSLFYKLEPKFLEETHAREYHLLEEALHACVETKEYKELREITSCDPFCSGVAVKSFGEYLLKLLPEVGDESPEQIQKQIDEMNKNDFKSDEDYEKKKQSLRDKLKKIAKAQKQAADGKLDPNALKAVLRKNLKKTLGDVEEAQSAISQFAGKEAGNLQDMGNIKEKLEIASIVKKNKKLKEISRLAGKYTRIASKKRALMGRSDEIGNIEHGNDVSKILASEFLMLKHPVLRKIFLKNFAENGLLQYKNESRTSMGKGPIIIALDSSGSMSGLEAESKGIALALLQIARSESRDFALAQFSSEGQLDTYVATKGKANFAELCKHLSFFFGGGTDFVTPLKYSMDLIETSRFKNADLIFLSDGFANVPDAFLKKFAAVKEEKKFHCYGVAIGGEGSSAGLAPFCDSVFTIEDLADEGQSDTMTSAIFTI